ncbi:MAG: DUF971 domain-containing protein [Cellvibrionaceae bacterium]|nr:DUF971 domain-containing protein [Cellvibrionaceae bacterium]
MSPKALKIHRKSAVLEVVFADGSFHLPAEYLRVFSPSAEVKGHGRETLPLNKQHVSIEAAQAQGNYAVKLVFSDGHDSGIYSWSYLRELGENRQKNWSSYLQKVATVQQQSAQETSAVKWVDPKADT